MGIVHRYITTVSQQTTEKLTDAAAGRNRYPPQTALTSLVVCRVQCAELGELICSSGDRRRIGRMKRRMREGGRDGSLHNDSSKEKAKAKFGIISIFSFSATGYYLQGGAVFFFFFFFYCGRSVCVCCSIVVGRRRRMVSL